MLRSTLAVLLSLSVLTACSRREDEDPPPSDAGTVVVAEDAGTVTESDAGIVVETDAGLPPPLTLPEFCTQAKEKVAGRLSACQSGPVDGWLAEDLGLCEYMQAAGSAGRLRYEASNAAACLALLDQLTCDALDLGITDVDNACKRTLEGLVPTDGACRDDLDCQLGNFCDESIYTCPAKCVAFKKLSEGCPMGTDEPVCEPGSSCINNVCTKKAAEGDPCGQGVADCGWALNCTVNGTAQLCVRNGSCLYNDECAPSHYCSGEDTEANPQVRGSCVSRLAIGSGCVPGDEGCVAFSYCSEDTQTCVKYGAVGESCGWEMEFKGCIGSFCMQSLAAEGNGEPGGTCTAFGNEGQACEFSGNGDECGKEGLCEWDPDDQNATSPICYVGCRTQTKSPQMPR